MVKLEEYEEEQVEMPLIDRLPLKLGIADPEDPSMPQPIPIRQQRKAPKTRSFNPNRLLPPWGAFLLEAISSMFAITGLVVAAHASSLVVPTSDDSSPCDYLVLWLYMICPLHLLGLTAMILRSASKLTKKYNSLCCLHRFIVLLHIIFFSLFIWIALVELFYLIPGIFVLSDSDYCRTHGFPLWLLSLFMLILTGLKPIIRILPLLKLKCSGQSV